MIHLPAYAARLGVIVAAETPELLLRLPFRPDLTGRPGFFHGGAITGLLEIAAYAALHQALADEGAVGIKPVTVTVDFMRGARESDLFATAAVVRLGSRIANVEATGWQRSRAQPVAAARMNLSLNRP